MKAFKTLPLLLVLMGLIPSCYCPDVDLYYIPQEMAITSIWNNSLYDDFEGLTIEEADGFELGIEFTKREFISERTPSFSFSNQAMAMQPCPEDGEQGLKHKATAIEIISNSDFLDIVAGASINHFFYILEYDQDSEQGTPQYLEVELENVISSINDSYFNSPELSMKLSMLPEYNLAHSFTVTLTFDNGSSLTNTSSEVQF
jgi:hypothetical protein